MSLSPELQKARLEIDNYYKTNPLMKLSFTDAVCNYLSYDKEFSDENFDELGADGDLSLFEYTPLSKLRHPISWLFNGCNHNNITPTTPDENQRKAARDLYELDKKYTEFYQAFTLANNDVMKLESQGSMIQFPEDYHGHIEYKIYNVLIASREPDMDYDELNMNEVEDPIHEMYDFVRVKNNIVNYPLNPKLVTEITEYFEAYNNEMFLLSIDFEFNGYSMKEFRYVFEALFSLAYIHNTACDIAYDTNEDYDYYYHKTYTPSCSELLNRTIRYTGVPKDRVQRIFDDLTYGNSKKLYPNLELQPLIKLSSKYYAISPPIWFFIQSEWSMSTLLSNLPSEYDIVDEFSKVKHDILTDKFNTTLSENSPNILCVCDEGLPENYIAIVHQSEKACLLIDLKWNIEPNCIYACIERSEEIKIACSQMLEYKQEITENPPELLRKYNIDDSYRIEGVIAPENWIGFGNIHTPDIPIIQVYHLIDKLETKESLLATIDWLIDREYMPKIGEDFSVLNETITIGDWSLQTNRITKNKSGTFYSL